MLAERQRSFIVFDKSIMSNYACIILKIITLHIQSLCVTVQFRLVNTLQMLHRIYLDSLLYKNYGRNIKISSYTDKKVSLHFEASEVCVNGTRTHLNLCIAKATRPLTHITEETNI
jgi:hypothetical protein